MAKAKRRRTFIERYLISLGAGLGAGILYSVLGILGAAMPPKDELVECDCPDEDPPRLA